MAIRQYIGARYVPKFYDNPNGTSEWLPNVIYEPLTIVTYDSNSYTSKKTVPASVGIPANNPEYWVATGNYNAFINEIREDIAGIQENITNIGEDITGIHGDLNDFKTDTENTLTAINATINNNILTSDSNIVVIGDSWTVGTHATHGLAYWLDSYLPHNDYHHAEENGSGFVTTGSGGNTFKDLLETLESSITDDSSITHIYVLGSLNDQGATNIDLAVNTFCTYAHNTFTNAKITIIAVNRVQFGDINRYDYVNAYSSAVAAFAYADFYDLTHHLPIDNWYNTSHLNEDGYQSLAKIVANVILGGSPSCLCAKQAIKFTFNGVEKTGYLYQSPDGAVTFRMPILQYSGDINAGGLVKSIHLTANKAVNGTENINGTPFIYATDAGGSRVLAASAYFNTATDLVIAWVDNNSSAHYTDLYIGEFNINFGLAY